MLFLFIMGHIFLLLCKLGDFGLDSIHCEIHLAEAVSISTLLQILLNFILGHS